MTLVTPLLITTLVISHLNIATGQKSCRTSIGYSGRCVSIFNCNSMLRLASSATPDEPVNLRSSFCGIDVTTKTVQVCCESRGCTTPERLPGTCVGLHSCTRLMQTLEPRLTLAAIKNVHQHICDDPEQDNVCCALHSVRSTLTSTESEGTCVLRTLPPAQKDNCCGVDSSTRNKIIGGYTTAVDEYPWLALIEYSALDVTKLLCGGVLISGRYVLTAGHCVAGPILQEATPVRVRLGEYNTDEPGKDCVTVEGGGVDCTNDTLSIAIEKSTPHPDFNPDANWRRHDIALIKLAQLVEYTDFIRPICLPMADFTTAAASNVDLYTAGWGATATERGSNIKLKVRVPYVPQKNCQLIYPTETLDGLICAGGRDGKDSCVGDSGGPLMRITEDRMELVGIVSFGPTPCGKDNIPALYTKIFYYLPWIVNHMATNSIN